MTLQVPGEVKESFNVRPRGADVPGPREILCNRLKGRLATVTSLQLY